MKRLQGVEAMLEEGQADPRFLRRHVGASSATSSRTKLGEAGVEKAWRYLGERLWKPLFTSSWPERAPRRSPASTRCSCARIVYDFRVTEDDEKFTFHLDYCPSGQRLMMEGKTRGRPRHPLNTGSASNRTRGASAGPACRTIAATPRCGSTCCPREWGKPMMKTKFGDFDAQGRVAGTPCMTFIYKQIPAGK